MSRVWKYPTNSCLLDDIVDRHNRLAERIKKLDQEMIYISKSDKTKLEPMICERCGGNINPDILRCEHCGTYFRKVVV